MTLKYNKYGKLHHSKTDIVQCIVFGQWNSETGRLGANHLYSDSISFGQVSSLHLHKYCPYDTIGPAPRLTITYMVKILNGQFLKSYQFIIT